MHVSVCVVRLQAASLRVTGAGLLGWVYISDSGRAAMCDYSHELLMCFFNQSKAKLQLDSSYRTGCAFKQWLDQMISSLYLENLCCDRGGSGNVWDVRL